MAISIHWGTRVINVPQADLTPLGGVLYQLDLDWFRLQLKNLEDSDEGMAFPPTHRHNTEVVLGTLVLARVIEIINGYTVAFEDGQYAVDLVGANSNVASVTNVNQVSVRSNNSTGLIGDIGGLVLARLLEGNIDVGQALRLILAGAAGEIEDLGGTSRAVKAAGNPSATRIEADVTAKERSNITLTP